MAGAIVGKACTRTDDTVCTLCPADTFNNNSICSPCLKCSRSEMEIAQCRPTADRVCANCCAHGSSGLGCTEKIGSCSSCEIGYYIMGVVDGIGSSCVGTLAFAIRYMSQCFSPSFSLSYTSIVVYLYFQNCSLFCAAGLLNIGSCLLKHIRTFR